MTPQPANLQQIAVLKKFGTMLVPMCRHCAAVRVESIGASCIGCVRVVANREQMIADQKRGHRSLFILSAILMLAMLAIVTFFAVQRLISTAPGVHVEVPVSP